MQWQQEQAALTMVTIAVADLTIEVVDEVVMVMDGVHNPLLPTLRNNMSLLPATNVENRDISLPIAQLHTYALLAAVLLLPLVALASVPVPRHQHVDMQLLRREGALAAVTPTVVLPLRTVVPLPVVPETMVAVPPPVMPWYAWLVQYSSSMP
jgi:hypothetical protein